MGDWMNRVHLHLINNQIHCSSIPFNHLNVSAKYISNRCITYFLGLFQIVDCS